MIRNKHYINAMLDAIQDRTAAAGERLSVEGIWTIASFGSKEVRVWLELGGEGVAGVGH